MCIVVALAATASIGILDAALVVPEVTNVRMQYYADAACWEAAGAVFGGADQQQVVVTRPKSSTAEEECNVYTNGPFVDLHASQDGKVRVQLPCWGKNLTRCRMKNWVMDAN